ncbi:MULTISPECIES: hypothetical protein [unclassified Streptomyces]|uniref:hypothetical protein n=1 Tax=unclassified Streptomyces TaxID=2593676 RepID=UPI002E12A317|nr:winged helix-turn-helix transcriptional regulator [Streptomyces sp. NBC_01197]
MLALALRHLERDGVVSHTVYAEVPRQQYPVRDCKTFGVTPDHGRCIDDQRQRDRGRSCRAV